MAQIKRCVESDPSNIVSRPYLLLFKQFQRFIETNFPENLTPGAYAERLHITPRHFNHTGKQVTGKTATEVIRKRSAGVFKLAPFGDTTEEIFDENVDVNFKGVFFTIQRLLPLIPDGGNIILNASIVAHIGLEGSSTYSAAKAAVLSLAKTLAVELAPRNIRVNCISPGPINTSIYGKAGLPEAVLQEFAAVVQGKIPLKRFGDAGEVARAAFFLANSANSGFVTGIELVVDGGKSITF
jgi:NADP-dependent 3-hydroxy acid dehydrogenase YdfG